VVTVVVLPGVVPAVLTPVLVELELLEPEPPPELLELSLSEL
jgi:hypothetical protein